MSTAMHDFDGPLPADCARCPLRLPLPDELSDAAVAHLVETPYLFAAAIENGYYSRESLQTGNYAHSAGFSAD